MLECQKSPAEVEEIFCFDEDDQFHHQQIGNKNKKNSADFCLSSAAQDSNQVNFKFDPSRLPNFENEEILSIRPQKNFSFDIMQQPNHEEWEPRVINRSSRCFDLSSMLNQFQSISMGTGISEEEEELYDYSVSFEDMTIEGLRIHLRSCFTCGVHWHEEQASLDCMECGGYGLRRPCPDCNGNCHETWTRDLDQSHSLGKARWIGSCSQNITTATA